MSGAQPLKNYMESERVERFELVSLLQFLFDREFYPDGVRAGRVMFRGVRARSATDCTVIHCTMVWTVLCTTGPGPATVRTRGPAAGRSGPTTTPR